MNDVNVESNHDKLHVQTPVTENISPCSLVPSHSAAMSETIVSVLLYIKVLPGDFTQSAFAAACVRDSSAQRSRTCLGHKAEVARHSIFMSVHDSSLRCRLDSFIPW